MNTVRVLRATVLVGLSAACWAGLSGRGNAASGSNLKKVLLFPVQDESSLERQVGAYLKTKGWTGIYKLTGPNKDDLYLAYPFKLDSGVRVKIIVDTLVSGRNAEKTITERVIKVYTWLKTGPLGKRQRAALLEFNNKFLEKYWAPSRVYIDKDGDLAFQTHINIPRKDAPIHAECVYDVMSRMGSAIDTYLERLAKTPGCQAVHKELVEQNK